MANKHKTVMQGVYLVRTEEELYSALYEFMECEHYPTEELDAMLVNHFVDYPAIVAFQDQTFDAGRILISYRSLGKLAFWLANRFIARD